MAATRYYGIVCNRRTDVGINHPSTSARNVCPNFEVCFIFILGQLAVNLLFSRLFAEAKEAARLTHKFR